MAKVSVKDALVDRAKQVAAQAGYSGVDEFIEHVLENELKRYETDDAEQQVQDQLRGLGYIE